MERFLVLVKRGYFIEFTKLPSNKLCNLNWEVRAKVLPNGILRHLKKDVIEANFTLVYTF